MTGQNKAEESSAKEENRKQHRERRPARAAFPYAFCEAVICQSLKRTLI